MIKRFNQQRSAYDDVDTQAQRIESRDTGSHSWRLPTTIVAHWSYSVSTMTGSPVARAIVVTSRSVPQHPLPASTSVDHHSSSVRVVPRWDKRRRELWLDGILIKRFRQPSPNQETVLSAFQEEGWPSFIDDPLPQHPDQDPKYRLNFTIRNLNRGHKRNLIRFEGDGTGEHVMWSLFSEPRL